jgi:hypothetical protein
MFDPFLDLYFYTLNIFKYVVLLRILEKDL